MLTIRGLNQFYGASHTLRDVGLEVRQGDCLCVMGRNGVGKTTLLRTIMGQLGAASGSIVFDGVDLGSRPPESRAGAGIGYVPQGREIFPQLTVEENLMLPVARGRRHTIPDLVFDCFPVLREMLRRRGGDLSGGQQQQLAVGRALALEPRFLILDEPTEGIQPNIVHQIGTILERLRTDEKITILLVEQRLPMARRVAQRFCLLDRGGVVARGDMEELSDDLVNAYLKV
ncbi:MAG TPA: urea ABC transporter ATP-binding subunit UrtE [Candidatus Acidoferrum sp.]|nr:urea ABC transporter ATP-binding subunit UrtE [Candidatus Acidoferrum sp.]